MIGAGKFSSALLLLSMLGTAACGHVENSCTLQQPVLSHIAQTNGVQCAGDNAIVVYLDRNTGAVSQGYDLNSVIRVLVRRGQVSDRYEKHGQAIQHLGNVTRFKPLDHAVLPLGFVRLDPGNAPPAWAEHTNGTAPDVGHFLAETEYVNGYFLQYLYNSSSIDDHMRIYSLVRSWAYRVSPNNSFKPKPLRGSA